VLLLIGVRLVAYLALVQRALVANKTFAPRQYGADHARERA